MLNVHYLCNIDKIKIQTRSQNAGKAMILDKMECNCRQRGSVVSRLQPETKVHSKQVVEH